MKTLYTISLFILLININTHAEDMMEGWTSNFIKANGIQLHVIRTNNDKPVMVMAHGGISNGLLAWGGLAKTLQEEYDIIMYDARGHGDSERTGPVYTLLDHADDLEHLVFTLDSHHPIVVGHSMGSYSTMMMAAKNPDLPRAVILIDPLLRVIPSKQDQTGIDQFQNWIDGLKQELHTLFEQKSDRVSNVDVHFITVLDDIAKLRLEDFERYFQKISCPILILSADSTYEEKKKENQFIKQFSNIQLVHIPGAGHVVHRDCPDESIKMIQSFLKEIRQ